MMNYGVRLQNLRFGTGLMGGGLLLAGLLAATVSGEAREVRIDDLSGFANPSASWRMAGDVSGSLTENVLRTSESGAGAIVNLPSAEAKGLDLISTVEHGDVEVELEYLLSRGGNSGLYLQGRYELQMLDSWGKAEPSFGDNGGLYQRWDESRPEGRKGFEGTPPDQNASRAPGIWQKLKVKFRAPRFDENGKKIENARILRAELNGATIHQNLELTGPTRGALSEEEVARGPLRIQGDHGPVALRNIRLVLHEDLPREEKPKNRVLVDPETTPVLRSFVQLSDGDLLTHAISVHGEGNVNYTYDLNTGALVQVWRGDFLDAPTWYHRGNGMTRPLGAVQELARKPVLAVARLESETAEWRGDPEAADFRARGYGWINEGQPVFFYELGGVEIEDAIRVLEEGRGIHRSLNVDGEGDFFVRVAAGSAVEELEPGLFAIGDHSYYVRFDEDGARPLRRESGGQIELLVPLRESVSYSILF